MIFVLDNTSIKDDIQFYVTRDDRIFMRKIGLENGYCKFEELIVEQPLKYTNKTVDTIRNI